MLSDFFYCGVVAGGAMLGIARMARAVPRGREVDPATRGLAVLTAAFAEALGILAIVIGLLAAFVALDDAGGPAAAVAVLVPALLLGVPAFMMLRLGDLPTGLISTRSLIILLSAYLAGLAILTLVVALSAVFTQEGAGADGFDVVVGILGLVGAAAAVGIGHVSGQAIDAVAAATASGEAADIDAIRTRTVLIDAILTGVGVLTVIAVMMLFFMAE